MNLKAVAIFVAAAFFLAAQSDLGRGWKSFSNRAGWTIRYPGSWRVSSCHSCDDLTHPDVSVFFSDRSGKGSVMIEHLIDKPTAVTTDEWLKDVSRTTVLVSVISEDWISVAGERALRVRHGDAAVGSENTYLVHEGKTFAIRADLSTDAALVKTFGAMLRSFHFGGQKN